MAINNLYPVFEVPEIESSTEAEEQKYKPSVYFDYELGDFRRDGANKLTVSDGKTAWKQWCIKMAMTERFSCLSYSSDAGIESNSIIQSERATAESELERTISEALMVNPRTEYVRDFVFTWNNSGLYCEFVVKGQDWEEQTMSVNLQT